MSKSINVQSAFKSYGNGDSKINVLNGLNMSVERGSIYSLIGASGCGKTTLLSCILGMKKLENGTVNVLGHEVIYDKPSKVGHLIGYMPQSTDLIPELSIRETLYYFGNIFQMDEKELNERYEMIKELLELPSENRRIENLSGGEKRRVSLAAAIIHNPLILILDEPTVGLDAILREKIWDFIINTTRTSHLSVIITTHYISEAQQSDRCGMMRDGVLLAEDTPQNIMTKYNSETLDEAFLNLCLLHYIPISIDEHYDINEVVVRDQSLSKRKLLSYQTLSTIFFKEFICLMRREVEIFVNFFFLFILMNAFFYGPGGNPNDIKLGIVNDGNCTTFYAFNDSYRIDDFNYSSCQFMNEIHDDDIIKINYNSFNEAYQDAKKGIISGVVAIKRKLVNLSPPFGISEISTNQIDIYLDKSDLLITTFIQNRIYNAYEKFNKNLLKRFNLSEKFSDSLMIFETPIYGSLYDDFKKSMMPIFLLQSANFHAIGFSCYSITQSRVDGIWDRTLLSGVRPIEILFAQFAFSFVVCATSFINGLFVTIYLLNINFFGAIWIGFMFGMLITIIGIFIGIILSTVTKSANLISLIIFTGSIVAASLTGLFWPLEGQTTILRYLSMSFPFTLPAISLKDVLIKKYGILQPSVYTGFFVCFTWIVGSFILACVAIKRKKYNVN